MEGDRMKIVLIYDSVSSSKLTAKVSEVIANTLRAQGLEVTSAPVGDAKHIDLKDFDALLIGSPTMAWAPTKATKEFLDGLHGKQFSGKKAGSFDTQIRSFISGNANKAMEKALKDLGFSIAVPHLQSYVESHNKVYRLVDGELDRAAKWAKELAEALR
jgi:flavodoxin